ncbi:hypothetical protein KCP74_06105 [Salmonella enterica subsp. enterica]|nr:hypothetical protein KCP74_06105 [Salmonella enterica subsp. enterica]
MCSACSGGKRFCAAYPGTGARRRHGVGDAGTIATSARIVRVSRRNRRSDSDYRPVAGRGVLASRNSRRIPGSSRRNMKICSSGIAAGGITAGQKRT